MKTIFKLDAKDIKKILAKKYKVKASDVELVYAIRENKKGERTEGIEAKVKIC